jgi:hypothetical protein
MSNSQSEEQSLFSQVKAFKAKYAEFVETVSEGLKTPIIKCEGSWVWNPQPEASGILKSFFNAVNAAHPFSPNERVETCGDYGTYITTKNFVYPWLPEVKEKLAMAARPIGEKKGPLSQDEKTILRTYAAIGVLIDGLKKDYVPLQKQLEAHRDRLNAKQERIQKINAEDARGAADDRFKKRLATALRTVPIPA